MLGTPHREGVAGSFSGFVVQAEVLPYPPAGAIESMLIP